MDVENGFSNYNNDKQEESKSWNYTSAIEITNLFASYVLPPLLSPAVYRTIP